MIPVLSLFPSEGNAEEYVRIETLDDQYWTVIILPSSILLKTNVHAKRTPPYLALVIKRRDRVIVYEFLFRIPSIEILSHLWEV